MGPLFHILSVDFNVVPVQCVDPAAPNVQKLQITEHLIKALHNDLYEIKVDPLVKLLL